MKNYVHKKEITVPLYRGVLVVVLSNSSKKVNGLFTGFELSSSEPYAHTILDNCGGKMGVFVVLNFENTFRKMKHGVIAHEAVHAAHFIAGQRGLVADFENDEPIAYLVEWVTDQVYKFMQKHKKSI